MAYNLRPLIQILEHILYPDQNRRPHWDLDPRKKPLIESLLTMASFLNELLEDPASLAGHDVRSLESRTRDAAHHAQSVIEYHLADQLLAKAYKRITISLPDSLQVIADREFEPIFDKVVNIMDGNGRGMRTGPLSSDLVSSSEDLNPKNIILGISDDVIQLKEKLFNQKSKLEIIPIVGMGGIGKTTLARILYDDEYVASKFDIRAWIVISQSYNEREILSGLLKCITGNKDGNNDPGLKLYQKLWDRRYLIVLDDMWSCDVWNSIRTCFPDNNQRSRIVVTTREQRVANSVGSSKHLHHYMELLNEAESWELLRQKVSSKECWGLQFEDIGKNIAKYCSGLPLAIHVVGGVLSSLDPTEEAWKRVAKDISSVNDGQISKILSLSYNHLPNHLKPCFLYMGAFPEDFQIQSSKLIKLWMAEGFLKPISGMSFEDAARVYLNQLVERNLLTVGRQETKRNVKSYIMHDVVRDMCRSKAQKEKFLYGGIDAINDLYPEHMLQLRLRVHASNEQVTQIIESPGMPARVCSLLLFDNTCVPHELSWLRKYAFGLRLLKVLDMLEVKQFVDLPKEMERLINLRYLAVCISNLYPGSISNLCYLQTLAIHLMRRDSFVGKVKELLGMPQLRHIKFKGYEFPLLGLEDEESLDFVNEELQTLSTVAVGDNFHRVLKATPNLKELGIHFSSVPSHSSTIDLSSLSQLRVLKAKCSWSSRGNVSLIFPHSLQKLTLHNFNIPRGFLNEIGGLPNLQVFKAIRCYISEDTMGVWEAREGEFKELRLLLLETILKLNKWIVDETHYPKLEHLMIYNCFDLEEIPSVIGYIPTLEIIEVRDSSTYVENSASKIQQEQTKDGNDTLQVLIIGQSKKQQTKSALDEATATLRGAEATLRKATMIFYGDMVLGNKVMKAEGTLREARTILQSLMVGKRVATIEVEASLVKWMEIIKLILHGERDVATGYQFLEADAILQEAVMRVKAIEREIAVVVGVAVRRAIIILWNAMVTKRVAKSEIVAESEATLAEGEEILAKLTETNIGEVVKAALAEEETTFRIYHIMASFREFRTFRKDHIIDDIIEWCVQRTTAESEKELAGLTEAKTKVPKAKAALEEVKRTWAEPTVVEAKTALAEAKEILSEVVIAAKAEETAKAEGKWAMEKANAELRDALFIVEIRKKDTKVEANATERKVHERLAEATLAMRVACEAERMAIEAAKEAKQEGKNKAMLGTKETVTEVETTLAEASEVMAEAKDTLSEVEATIALREAYETERMAIETVKKAKEKQKSESMLGTKATVMEVKTTLAEASIAVEKAKKSVDMAAAKAAEASAAVEKAIKAIEVTQQKKKLKETCEEH